MQQFEELLNELMKENLKKLIDKRFEDLLGWRVNYLS
jgi:hypothetical protein